VIALSLWDPWGTAMMLGLKHVETRGWYCQYRGPLVIHVARSRDAVDHIQRSPLWQYLAPTGYGTVKPWPLGCAVAVVEVIDCQPVQQLAPTLSPMELAFGDYRQFGDDGKQRYGIITTHLIPFEKPIPWKGAQGFWNYTGPLPEGVRRAG